MESAVQRIAGARPSRRRLAASLGCSLLSVPTWAVLWTKPAYPTVPGWLACFVAFGLQATGLLLAIAFVRHPIRRRPDQVLGWLAVVVAVAVFVILAGFLVTMWTIVGWPR